MPTRGMERWLTQRLSTGLGATPGRADGVCANVEFPSPRRLADEAVAVASGIEPDADAWLPERLVWPLLEVVDDVAARAVAAEPRRPPRRDARHGRPAAPGAALRQRPPHRRAVRPLRAPPPGMVRAWAAGRDVDATGARLPPDARWQAELWRRLRARAGQPDPAERIEAACARLREEPGLVELPDRLSVFGLTRLPAGRLQVLRALGARRDVHLFLLHPSPALWERVAGRRRRSSRRAEDVTRELPANRLLASWGQDVRELQLVAGPPADADHHHADGRRRRHAARRASRPTCARTARRPGRRCPAAPDERLELGRRPQHPGPRLPRPRPPGRGAARRDPAPARRGPDARAARRDRDVPGHRDVRAADPRDVRRRRDLARGRRARGPARGAAPARPARPARRPLAAPDQPGARRRRAPARARRPAR